MTNIFEDLAKAGIKVGDFLVNIATGAKKLQQVYSALSGPTIAATSAVFFDVVKAATAATSAATDAQAGNFTGAIQLSETTVTLVKQVITDAKAGEATIKADFALLGIKL